MLNNIMIKQVTFAFLTVLNDDALWGLIIP